MESVGINGTEVGIYPRPQLFQTVGQCLKKRALRNCVIKSKSTKSNVIFFFGNHVLSKISTGNKDGTRCSSRVQLHVCRCLQGGGPLGSLVLSFGNFGQLWYAKEHVSRCFYLSNLDCSQMLATKLLAFI